MMLLHQHGPLYALLTLLVLSEATREKRGFRDRIQARNKAICKDRPLNQFFRKDGEENCATVVKCVDARGDLKLVPTKCSPPLVFDIDHQICNYVEMVNNCDRSDKDPDLEEDSAEKIPTEEEEEEEKEGECDQSQCVLPDCFCSPDGTQAPSPGGAEVDIKEIPQIINIAFNGAVNGDNMEIYMRLFKKERINPNGCTVKGTFFVSHKYTNYSAVQELHRQGHEIAVFSVTNNEDELYWKNGGFNTWYEEMEGGRKIIERWANITDGSILGMRAPFLRVGGNTQFQMMNESLFPFDSSITAPLADVPIWPYTLDYNIPHSCHTNINTLGGCPSEHFPLWEIPINELDRREDPTFDEDLTGCQLVSSCTNVQEKEHLRTLLQHNFERHYKTNRAPLSLSFNPSWLIQNPDFVQVISDWMDSVLSSYPEAYFMTEFQLLLWMMNPVTVQTMKSSLEFQDKCIVEGQPACQRPNVCPLTSRQLPGETNRLHTCMECPQHYPWLRDPDGLGKA